jgi:hypothetical protein
MFVDINTVKDTQLEEMLAEHYRIGGVLNVSVFEIKENYEGYMPDEYTAHMVVARQALEKVNYTANFNFNKDISAGRREEYFFSTNYDLLDKSGRKISLREFMGPHYDFERSMPLVIGQLGNDTLNAYFYYDQPETIANKIDINKCNKEYIAAYPDYQGGFVYALMDTPYNLKLGDQIAIRGKYADDFIRFFFDTLEELVIYAWSTDTSPVFDAGKEWWGAYFWTVYNPVKNWYIGIIASSTD